jgi:hypothetical protein
MNDEPAWRRQFEQMGVNQVRAQVTGNRYTNELLRAAVRWLGEKDHEEARLKAASEASAKEDAREANRLAAEANSIAREASASAKRSADAARTNNRIAVSALIAAIVAIAISIISMFIKH